MKKRIGLALFAALLALGGWRPPASATSRLPSATLPLESPISALISRAAAAERWARLRTSLATTAFVGNAVQAALGGAVVMPAGTAAFWKYCFRRVSSGQRSATTSETDFWSK